MINFFRVTDQHHRKQVVNPYHVRSVREGDSAEIGTVITFANGDDMHVKESIDAVMAAMRGASPSA